MGERNPHQDRVINAHNQPRELLLPHISHRCSDVCVTHGSPEERLFRLEDHYALMPHTCEQY
jgi:hypothetical protein